MNIENKTKQNEKYKDSIFTDLFQNHPENFLSLYNAIHNTDLKMEEVQIQSQRLEQAVYHTTHNDVSMMINGHWIILMEHQSTINENMPLRLLDYITKVYEKLVSSEKRYKKSLCYIPTPEFYVFYNGTDPYPDEKVLKLSDAFITKTDSPVLELKVTVYNIHNPTAQNSLNILNNCDILKQYCDCIDIIRKTCIKGNPQSYDAAIAECLKKGLLGTYMQQYTKARFNMLLEEYDYETDIRVQREESFEAGEIKGRKEGEIIGKAEAKLEGAVIAVRKYNALPENVALDFDISLEELLTALER